MDSEKLDSLINQIRFFTICKAEALIKKANSRIKSAEKLQILSSEEGGNGVKIK